MGANSKCVSLGSDCQVGWQLRRHFDEPIPSPFDWIVTPFSALESILEDRGERFSRSVSILPACPPYAQESTVCDDYGCSYHHDFPHDDQQRVIVTADALAATRAKMLHKWQSFDEIVRLQDEVLFVHLGTFKTPPIAWPYLAEESAFPISRVNALRQRLADMFPTVTCHLLQVTYPEITPLNFDALPAENVSVAELPVLPNLNWDGHEESWGKILHPYRRFDRRAAPPCG